MNRFSQFGERLFAWLAAIAALILLAMVALVTADIILRNTLGFGFAWSNEITEYALYLITLLTAPGCFAAGSTSVELVGFSRLKSGTASERFLLASSARFFDKSSSAFLFGLVTSTTVSMPEATAPSTMYWMTGLPAIGSISFGTVLVNGSSRVPKPAAASASRRASRSLPSLVPASCPRLASRLR